LYKKSICGIIIVDNKTNMLNIPKPKMSKDQRNEKKNKKTSIDKLKSVALAGLSATTMAMSTVNMPTAMAGEFRSWELREMSERATLLKEAEEENKPNYTRITKEQVLQKSQEMQILNDIPVFKGNNIILKSKKNSSIKLNGTHSISYVHFDSHDSGYVHYNIGNIFRAVNRVGLPSIPTHNYIFAKTNKGLETVATQFDNGVNQGLIDIIDKYKFGRTLFINDYNSNAGIMKGSVDDLNYSLGNQPVVLRKGEKWTSNIRTVSNKIMYLPDESVILGTNGQPKINFENCAILIANPRILNDEKGVEKLLANVNDSDIYMDTDSIPDELVEKHNAFLRDRQQAQYDRVFGNDTTDVSEKPAKSSNTKKNRDNDIEVVDDPFKF
jgi:hypothetical protein